jgi:hypothetical protein
VPERIVPAARWGYTFTPVPAGTVVEESWRLLNMYPQLEAAGDEVISGLPLRMAGVLETKLEALKERFEGGRAR